MKYHIYKHEEDGSITLIRSCCTAEEAVECSKAFNEQEEAYPRVFYFAGYGDGE